MYFNFVLKNKRYDGNIVDKNEVDENCYSVIADSEEKVIFKRNKLIYNL